MWRLIMRLKNKQENKVRIVLKDGYSKKSKTITVYDCTVEKMMNEIKKIIESNPT